MRRATPRDASEIAAVDVASWRAAYRGLMPDAYIDALSVEEKAQAWEGSLGREDIRRKRTLVAEAGGAIVGYATVGPDTEDPQIGLLYLMYTHPEWWGRGAGRSLMRGAESALRDLGFAMAVLWVLEANERARRFYSAAGWRDDGATQSNDYGSATLGALRMSKRLDPGES